MNTEKIAMLATTIYRLRSISFKAVEGTEVRVQTQAVGSNRVYLPAMSEKQIEDFVESVNAQLTHIINGVCNELLNEIRDEVER